ncbi:MAG TPA: ABC transporter permease [Candidatus Dormibacteraeota bacterium]|jgi:putative ABC transport system permease protein|nr:ABC transporter permease [Candidatus Dormibacteraeota bacterium]
MSIPIIYNLRNIRARWTSAIVAILGIAGTVGVFVAMLSLARGFRATLVSSGAEDNAIVLRAGATSEITSSLDLDTVKILQDAPGVAQACDHPLVTPEVVVVATFPLRSTGTDANVQVRGVSPNVLEIRKNVKISQGRMFQVGLPELIVGKNASLSYTGLTLGNTVNFGGGHWLVVGVFDAKGTAFDSEVWCDTRTLDDVYKQPSNIFQSATVHLASAADFQQFRSSVTSDPRLNVAVSREIDYYAQQSQVLTILITILGGIVAAIMTIGAVFGALNTMYSAIAERGREIATIRALGFGGPSVVISFLLEALLIAFVGGVVGCIAVLPINGLTTGAMNWQTFSRLTFAFKITPGLLAMGILFALAMGALGGMLPAIRAARRPIAPALRSL